MLLANVLCAIFTSNPILLQMILKNGGITKKIKGY